jgi:hypothetical protein
VTENLWAGMRGVWLTVCLIYVGLSNAWWTYRSLNIYLDLVSHHDPRVPHWPFLLLGILSAIAIVAVVGLWMLRKWGIYLYLACWAGAFGASLALHVAAGAYLPSLAGLFLLCVVLWPKRDELH